MEPSETWGAPVPAVAAALGHDSAIFNARMRTCTGETFAPSPMRWIWRAESSRRALLSPLSTDWGSRLVWGNRREERGVAAT